MFRRFAWFFLVLFLLQSTQLGEFIKLPALVNHYLQHRDQNANITLLHFLKIHYLDKQEVDDDYAQDMQLPFKTLDNHNLAMQLSLPPFYRVEHRIGFSLVKTASVYRPPLYALLFSASIFQPPRAQA